MVEKEKSAGEVQWDAMVASESKNGNRFMTCPRTRGEVRGECKGVQSNIRCHKPA